MLNRYICYNCRKEQLIKALAFGTYSSYNSSKWACDIEENKWVSVDDPLPPEWCRYKFEQAVYTTMNKKA